VQISVVNHSNGKVTDEDLQTAIRAINRQIREDFAPYWRLSGALRLEGRSAENPNVLTNADMRGDAVIYLWDRIDVEPVIGVHRLSDLGIPYGFVYTELAQAIGEPWSVALSHEALEVLADPETNRLVMGPHPEGEPDVFHWLEVCDAVQAESYQIDDVSVSNFVLPLYFTGTRDTDEPGARNDFLGRTYGGQTLRSFKINPGGYIGFYNPESASHEMYSIQDDPVARMRRDVKGRARGARRSVRYRTFPERRELLRRPVEEGEGRPEGPERIYALLPEPIAAPAAEASAAAPASPAEAPRAGSATTRGRRKKAARGKSKSV
jgi:hypothetical protein